MKSGKDLFAVCALIILLMIAFRIDAQNKSRQFKAYLIVNNTSGVLKGDSLFNIKLTEIVRSELKRKNYVLVSNNEMEEAEKPYLYIYATISDSLKISARKSLGTDKVIVMPYPEKTWGYSDESGLTRKVIYYIKNYIK